MNGTSLDSQEKCEVSVIICTRNRENQINRAVKSVLDNSYSSFELLVVDQSTTSATRDVLDGFRFDQRFQYLHTTTKGLSIARNIGIRNTVGSIIIYTDDDCEARPDWIEQIVKYFEHNLQVGAVFGRVEPASEFDLSKGWLPIFLPKATTLIRDTKRLHLTGVMGANMAFRRYTVEQIHGFDEQLGAGQILQSAEDVDMAYRVLIYGRMVCILPQASVIHYGFRAYQSREGAITLLNTMFGNGAYYAKHIRCRDGVAAQAYVIEFWKLFKSIISKLIKKQKPLGLRLLLFFIWGFLYSFRFKINTEYRLFFETNSFKKGE